MPRLIEIALFLLPFAGFAAWRLLFPSPSPPLWMLWGGAGIVVVMLLSLLWLRQMDANDADAPYTPARLDNGRVVAPRPGPVP
jgi:hypothetical protein